MDDMQFAKYAADIRGILVNIHWNIKTIWIRKQGYEPETSMENLITNIFAFYESEIENHVSDYDTKNGNFNGSYTEAAQAFVRDSGGLSEFDYEC